MNIPNKDEIYFQRKLVKSYFDKKKIEFWRLLISLLS